LDATTDPRFAAMATQSSYQSIISLPMFSNRDQVLGGILLASKYPFSRTIMTVLTYLSQQASTSIANSLLFRSVQAGTREHLKMISSQKEALEQARRHREEAEKATQVRQDLTKPLLNSFRLSLVDQKQLPGIYVT
jgi:GAF domain-containing protein